MIRVGVLLAVPLLVGTLLGTASAASATTTSVPAPELGPVRVSIARVSPASPAPGDTLVVSGRAVNAGALTIGDVGVRILIDRQPIGSRAALAEAAATDVSDPAIADAGGTVIESSVVQGLTPDLAPGASGPFTITLPADDLGLGGFGGPRPDGRGPRRRARRPRDRGERPHLPRLAGRRAGPDPSPDLARPASGPSRPRRQRHVRPHGRRQPRRIPRHRRTPPDPARRGSR